MMMIDGKVVTHLNEFSYDAWGRMRNPDDWRDYSLAPGYMDYFNLSSRGYTSHEHLIEYDLINMNARLYDPVECQFLTPDKFIQAPEFAQNYNRYTYAFNNPLKYTDPTGNYNFFDMIGDWINGRDIQWDKLYFEIGFSYGGSNSSGGLDFGWSLSIWDGNQQITIGGDFSICGSKYGDQSLNQYDYYYTDNFTSNNMTTSVIINEMYINSYNNGVLGNPIFFSTAAEPATDQYTSNILDATIRNEISSFIRQGSFDFCRNWVTSICEAGGVVYGEIYDDAGMFNPSNLFVVPAKPSCESLGSKTLIDLFDVFDDKLSGLSLLSNFEQNPIYHPFMTFHMHNAHPNARHPNWHDLTVFRGYDRFGKKSEIGNLSYIRYHVTYIDWPMMVYVWDNWALGTEYGRGYIFTYEEWIK